MRETRKYLRDVEHCYLMGMSNVFLLLLLFLLYVCLAVGGEGGILFLFLF